MSKRTFIAQPIVLSEHLKNEIEKMKQDLRGLNIKWVENYNLHLTLNFFGETTQNKIDEIGDHLEILLKKYARYKIRLFETGAFKSMSHPQVLWIGIEADKTLENLYHDIQKLAGSLGFEKDNHPFSPHLTLGRVKCFSTDNNLKELAAKHNPRIDEIVDAENIIFYESILTTTGPVYKPIRIYKLSDN